MPKIGTMGPTDSGMQRVSLYGRKTVAGDTALAVTTANGMLWISPTTIMSPTDAVGDLECMFNESSGGSRFAAIAPYLYNGSTRDRQRGNVPVTVGASAARTAVLTGADMINYNHRGGILIVNVTARAAATTLSVVMQIKDSISAGYKTVWTVAAPIDTAAAMFSYQFYPLAVPTVLVHTEHLNMISPRTVRFVVTPSDANSVTYSVSFDWIL